jgi:hypothetical protein
VELETPHEMMVHARPMTWSWLAVTVLAFSCSHSAPQPQPPPQPQLHSQSQPDAASDSNKSPFDTLELSAGMTREQAEKSIAVALGKERSDYSPYGNNLRGGTVEYKDATGLIILEVIYAAGTPAPWVTRPNGVAEHYPPVDESVISFRTSRR